MPPEYLLLDGQEYNIAEFLELDAEIEGAGDFVIDDQFIPVFRGDDDQWLVAPGYEDEVRKVVCLYY